MKTITFDQMIDGIERAGNIDFTSVLLDGCLQIEAAAKMKCPVDTGELRRSIKAETTGKNSATVGTDLYYAEYVEYGTIKQKPQPYMEPAVLENIDNIKKKIADRISEELV